MSSSFILDLAANQKFLMVVPPDILAEYAEVLRRPRFSSAGVCQPGALVIRKTSEPRPAARQAFDLTRTNPITGFTSARKPAKRTSSSPGTSNIFRSTTKAQGL